jgi:hypothetical protein
MLDKFAGQKPDHLLLAIQWGRKPELLAMIAIGESYLVRQDSPRARR